MLGSSSPVLYKLLFELDETVDNPERRLILDPSLGVTLTISQADNLFLKHDSRILRSCWDVLKVSAVFLSGLWALPILLFSAQILA